MQTEDKRLEKIQGKADDLLYEIAALSEVIAAIEGTAELEMRLVAERYWAKLDPFQRDIEKMKTELISLMKKERKILFDGRDIVHLDYGDLLCVKDQKVSIPRDALEKCEELHFDDAIKIAKSLDREAVEKWPDEKLFLIGAERKPVTKFSYEVKK